MGKKSRKQQGEEHLAKAVKAVKDSHEAAYDDRDLQYRVQLLEESMVEAHKRLNNQHEKIVRILRRLPEWPEPPTNTTSHVHALLEMISISIPMGKIDLWDDEQRAWAVAWAMQQHMMASDNEFYDWERIQKPPFLDPSHPSMNMGPSERPSEAAMRLSDPEDRIARPSV